MLRIRSISLQDANEFVIRHHRHHCSVVGHKFSIACVDEHERVHSVAIVGRPVSRYLDDGLSLEVTGLCTDGTKNACSILYAAAWRAAVAMGYRHIYTYILETEQGVSLRAAGWTCDGRAGGKNWTGIRFRPDEVNAVMKQRFSRHAVPTARLRERR